MALNVLYLDLETYPRDGIDPFLPNLGEAPANYRDEAKIKAYLEDQRQAIKARAALDPDLAQVVALGLAVDDREVMVIINDEPKALLAANVAISQADRIVGFNLPGFDLRVLSRRALLLNVPFPNLELGKYRYDHRIIDLQHKLSWGDGPQKGKSLAWYCRLFGVTDGSEDTSNGSDIAALVKAGDWAAVEQHCRCDVERTRALAKRLGLVRAQQAVTA